MESKIEYLIMERNWIQESIDNEYELNAQRINGYLVFNAILFGALGVLVSTNIPIEIGIVLFLFGMCFLGAVVSYISMRSVNAGINQIEELKKRRELIFQKINYHLKIEIIGADLSSINHNLGLMPIRWYPKLLVLAWFLIFIWILCLGKW